MKIGIITWFSGTNYGTHLQAIALQKYIRSLGYEVWIINFEVNANTRKVGFWEKVCRQPQKYMTKYAQRKYKEEIASRDNAFKKMIQCQCCMTERINTKEEYIRVCNQFDLLICGSDQIWNPNWYHRAYYADYAEITAEKISYAPSMGINTIPEKFQDEIRRSLQSFRAVSVREEKGAEILESLSPVKPQVVVDPTLLLKAGEWSELALRKSLVQEPYVLSMFLTDRREHWRAANRFAKKKNLEHVIIPYCGFSYVQPGKIFADAGIEELLALIKNATYILTDSFHITVFSLIFNRQFITFQRFRENDLTSQNARVNNLLKIAEIPERMISYKSKHVPDMGDIDYKTVNKYLDEKINKSKAYLREVL